MYERRRPFSNLCVCVYIYVRNPRQRIFANIVNEKENDDKDDGDIVETYTLAYTLYTLCTHIYI